MDNKANPMLLAKIFLGLLCFSGAVQAQFVPRVENGTAVASCQGALPAFEGSIRKRPLGIQNEGTATAFVTCAFRFYGFPTRAIMYLSNTDTANVAVTCTAVNGHSGGMPIYVPKTVFVAPDGEPHGIFWVTEDFGGNTIFPRGGWVSMSCSLPPGTAINDATMEFQEWNPESRSAAD